jgi:sulfur relay (sulfurtransferase) DsrC/TusE family protein
MNFGQNWNDWRASLRETVNAAREIDPSDRHVVEVVEDMIDFLAQRVCSGSPEERVVAELWNRATSDEREGLARIFLRMIESGPTASP